MMTDNSYQQFFTKLTQAGLIFENNQDFTLLLINVEETLVLSGNHHAQPPTRITLPLGSQKTARDYFHHQPPTPMEIETAINTVEDIIIPLHHHISPSSILLTTDNLIKQVALLSGVAQASVMLLSLEAMEQVFNRFADIVSGRPATLDLLPDSPEFAATLLILREWMHHLRFEKIYIYSEV
jgi:hypothetical protein